MSSKKKKRINKSKQKTSIRETSSKKTTISSLDKSNKKELPVSIPVTKKSNLKAKNIDIAMIDADAYHIACFLKKAQVFAILMKNIQYQTMKQVRTETDPRSVISQEYHDFFDVFLKKNLDTLFLYQKYNHKIHLEEEQKSSYALLYKMSFKELDAVKQYFNFYLAKKFIQASSAFYFSLILFIKKLGGGI